MRDRMERRIGLLASLSLVLATALSACGSPKPEAEADPAEAQEDDWMTTPRIFSVSTQGDGGVLVRGVAAPRARHSQRDRRTGRGGGRGRPGPVRAPCRRRSDRPGSDPGDSDRPDGDAWASATARGGGGKAGGRAADGWRPQPASDAGAGLGRPG